jgi:hypothetical protein
MKVNTMLANGYDSVDYLKDNSNTTKEDIVKLTVISPDVAFAIEWDDPILMDELALPEISPSILPGIYGEFAEALAEATETPPEMVIMNLLGVISASVSPYYFVCPAKGWDEPINIYAITGLPPANLKSIIVKECNAPLTKWEKAQEKILEPKIEDAMTQNALIDKVIGKLENKVTSNPEKMAEVLEEIKSVKAGKLEVPIKPQIFITDATPEALATVLMEQNGSIAILTDEGGVFEVLTGLYNSGNANLDVVLNGFSGESVKVRRQKKSFNINPKLTIVVTAQPAIIEKLGNRKSTHGIGLTERFLYLLPESHIGFRTLDTEPVPDKLRKEYHAAITKLLDLRLEEDPSTRKLTLSNSSRKVWQEFRSEIEIMMRPDGRLYPIQGWAGKLGGQVLRLAGLMHIMKHGDDKLVIDASTMKMALKLTYALIEHAILAFGLMSLPVEAQIIQDMIKWIIKRNEPKLTRRDFQRGFQTLLPKADDTISFLDELVSRSIIQDVAPTKNKKGRPSGIYEVNPKLIESCN